MQSKNHRQADKREYIASLTGLRGIAAFSVFLFHYSALHPGIRLDLSIPVIGYFLQLPLGLGFAGVDLFFVLSGFLLSLPFAESALAGTPRPSSVGYFKRRLLRVFPAYYAQLIIILLAGAWFVTWKPIDGISLLAHLLMFFNIGADPVRPLVGLWWTLPVELSFYLILPLIAVFMRPRKWFFIMLAGFAISIAYRIWSASDFETTSGPVVFLIASQLPGSLPEFLLGASAAILVKQVDIKGLPRPSMRSADLLFVLGVVLTTLWLSQIVFTYGTVYWRGHWSMVIAPIALGTALTLLVLGLYWGSRIGKWLCGNPVVYFIGLISYSLYLWHFVVMQQILLLGGEPYAQLPELVRFGICTLLVTVVSALSYFLVERPFFKLRGARK
ncbi:MAG: peptidoglycan/LPS O-acetylase OafA/YrhL [Lysobacterales bacterium]|jgi:peptidoglycan/LPS O-acetylase OafA/YrhL